MTRRLHCVIAFVLFVAAGCGQPPATGVTGQAGAPGAPDPRLAASYRFDRNGWIFVHLEGPPATLGFQHGYLLAKETGDLLRVFRLFAEHQTKREWAFFRRAAEEILWPKIEPEYRQELDGIVAGLNANGVAADRWDVVALNAIEELPENTRNEISKLGHPVEAIIPYDEMLIDLDLQGEPLLKISTESPSYQSVRKMLQDIKIVNN